MSQRQWFENACKVAAGSKGIFEIGGDILTSPVFKRFSMASMSALEKMWQVNVRLPF